LRGIGVFGKQVRVFSDRPTAAHVPFGFLKDSNQATPLIELRVHYNVLHQYGPVKKAKEEESSRLVLCDLVLACCLISATEQNWSLLLPSAVDVYTLTSTVSGQKPSAEGVTRSEFGRQFCRPGSTLI